MKKSIVLGLIFISCITSLYAQDFKPWNVALSTTYFYQNFVLEASVNRELGKRFEVGIMPIYQFSILESSTYSSYNQESYGINATGRFFIGRGNVLEPYVATIIGFGAYSSERTYTYGSTTEVQSSDYNFFDAALLLGNELKMGKKGWIFDFNVGLLYTKPFIENSGGGFELLPIYTFGVKKKFRRK